MRSHMFSSMLFINSRKPAKRYLLLSSPNSHGYFCTKSEIFIPEFFPSKLISHHSHGFTHSSYVMHFVPHRTTKPISYFLHQIQSSLCVCKLCTMDSISHGSKIFGKIKASVQIFPHHYCSQFSIIVTYIAFALCLVS